MFDEYIINYKIHCSWKTLQQCTEHTRIWENIEIKQIPKLKRIKYFFLNVQFGQFKGHLH